jgi:hypothetical protein
MDFIGWLAFEVSPWIVCIESLAFIPFQWVYGDELIPMVRGLIIGPDSITNLKADLAAAKAELDAL